MSEAIEMFEIAIPDRDAAARVLCGRGYIGRGWE